MRRCRLACCLRSFIGVSASQGAGTDDDVLIEILASRTGEQIQEIVKVYKKGDSFRRERANSSTFLLVVLTCLRVQPP